jgi:hypothetical protein
MKVRTHFWYHLVYIIAPVQTVVLFFFISVSGINQFGHTRKWICDVISGGGQIHVTIFVNMGAEGKMQNIKLCKNFETIFLFHYQPDLYPTTLNLLQKQ